MGEVKTLNQPELPSNSRKSKQLTNKQPEKKLKPIVNREDVVKKKKSTGRKFADAFFGEDITNVKDYLIFDIVIPSLKDGIIDAVTNGLSMLLNGERGSRVNRVTKRSSVGTNYNKVYTLNGTQYGSDSKRFVRGRDSRYSGRGGLEDDIILGMKAEAEEVLESMICYLEDNGEVSVGELYDLLGQSSSFTDRQWGWTDLSSARVVRVAEGYLIRFPRCEHL